MGSTNHDSNQWLSMTEETLFMHDGLVRVSDLVELPFEITDASVENDNDDHELLSFDSKTPQELSQRLLTICRAKNNAYYRLLQYRTSAVKGLWKAQIQVAVDIENEKKSTSKEETIALLKKQGLLKESENASFSTRVSLLLVTTYSVTK